MFSSLEIEAYAASIAAQRKANQEDEEDDSRVAFGGSRAAMDEDIYGSAKDKFAGYVTSIADNDDAEADVSYCLLLYFNRMLNVLYLCVCRTMIMERQMAPMVLCSPSNPCMHRPLF